MSLDICLKTIKIAEKQGADQAECYFFYEDSLRADLRKGQLKKIVFNKDRGIAIRAVIGKKIGFYYSTDLSDIEKTVYNALKLAKAGTEDPYFVSLPEKKPYEIAHGIYDRDLEEISVENISNFFEPVLKGERDVRIKSVNAGLSISRYEYSIANSLGIEASEKATYCSFEVSISAEEEGKYSSSHDFISSKRIKDLNPSEIYKNACDLAIKGLNKKKVESRKLPVILDPLASLYMIGIALNGALNADNVQRKRSFLSEELGKEIGSENLNVLDDGLLEGAVGSSSFDGEGSPSKKKVLIEKGVLKSFLYDNYTAKKENRESTGNAVRASFRSLPSISVRNFIFLEGKVDLESMISELKHGIYLRSTFDTPNIITGEFSGMINEGFYIENGEMKFSLLQAGIGMTLKDLFSKITEVSKEYKWVENFRFPYILISEANIAGQ